MTTERSRLLLILAPMTPTLSPQAGRGRRGPAMTSKGQSIRRLALFLRQALCYCSRRPPPERSEENTDVEILFDGGPGRGPLRGRRALARACGGRRSGARLLLEQYRLGRRRRERIHRPE